MSLKGFYTGNLGFPGDSVVQNPPANAGDVGSIPGSRRSPGEGNGNPLQYSCLGNPMDRRAWRATIHEVAKQSRHDLATIQQHTGNVFLQTGSGKNSLCIQQWRPLGTCGIWESCSTSALFKKTSAKSHYFSGVKVGLTPLPENSKEAAVFF